MQFEADDRDEDELERRVARRCDSRKPGGAVSGADFKTGESPAVGWSPHAPHDCVIDSWAQSGNDYGMNTNSATPTSRRDFIKQTSTIVAASALAGVALPHVHAAGNSTIQVALVGCGGRGTDAAGNALSVTGGGTKLVAMADVFQDRLTSKYGALQQRFGAQVEVPSDRRFLGFDGYMKAMDCLKSGDIVILTTPPAFRWVHFTYAIEKGLKPSR
jgi:hypothetical protein